jgi:predicted PurR-regulated permease PerM
VPLALLIATIAQETQNFFRALNDGTLDSSQYWRILDRLGTGIGMEPGQAESLTRARLQQLGGEVVQRTVIAAGAATSAILQLIVMIGAFHMSLLHGRWLHAETLLHSPLGPERTETLLGTVRQMIRASFFGVVAVAAAQGTLLGIAAWIAGLPIPALWGLATAGFSVLPILGSALVWIPGTLLLLAKGSTGMAIFFLIWGAVLVANSDNVVRPLVVMNSLHQVNGLLVFIAILGGIQAFGFTGVLAGPVTLAVGIALLRMLREELQNSGA